MLIWLLFSIIALLLAYFASLNNQGTRSFQLFQALLIVWLSWFVSFGSVQATDHYSYVDAYKIFEHYSLSDLAIPIQSYYYSLMGSSIVRLNEMEVGYVFLNMIFNWLGFSVVGFLFIYALIVNTLLVKFIYRYDYPVFAILILIGDSYSQQANLVRQMMAVSIFLYATKYIMDRNFMKYSVSIFIASLIHVSAIILIPLYFIANKNIPQKLMLALWLVSVYINYLGIELSFFQQYVTPFYNITFEKFGREVEEQGLSLAINLFMLLFVLFKSDDWDNHKKYNLPLNMFFIGCVLFNMSSLSFHFYRFSIYLTIFSIIMIPQLSNYLFSSPLQKVKNWKYAHNMLNITLIVFYGSIVLRKVLSDNIAELGAVMYNLNDIFKP